MIYLTEPTLGQLDLDCDPDGYVVSEFQIGFPSERPVVVLRSLADGVRDTSRFVGQRAITVTITLDQTKMATQDLLDRLMPYLSPRYRPRLVYSVQEPVTDPSHVRSFEVRGADAPLAIGGPKFQTLVCQWRTVDYRATSVEELCKSITATGAEEFGRTYDLTFDRNYPYSPPVGATDVIMGGNIDADWNAKIVGGVDDPVLRVNGVEIAFTGVSVANGQTLEIDTRTRTMIQGGNLSVYGNSNFSEWEWDDLLLQPGNNMIQYSGSNLFADSYLLFCHRDSWI